MTDIKAYHIPNGLSTENAGMCQWGFATKDGREFFIKEFLSPKYPVDDSVLGPELTKKMRGSAEAFYNSRQKLYEKLKSCRNGNIMVVLDFFRHETKYYAVADKVTGRLLSIDAISKLSPDAKKTLTRSLLYSMSLVHQTGIVHSDIRPENILVKQTQPGFCTAKIIDFDAGFLEEEQPNQISGSQPYFSPEAIRKTNGAEVVITTKSDVWAIGLLIHQYWCGKMPSFSKEYHYAGEAALNDSSLILDRSIPADIAKVIQGCLQKDPASRPDMKAAFEALADEIKGPDSPPPPPPPPGVLIPLGDDDLD